MSESCSGRSPLASQMDSIDKSVTVLLKCLLTRSLNLLIFSPAEDRPFTWHWSAFPGLCSKRQSTFAGWFPALIRQKIDGSELTIG
jgi:hypothetical protein